MAIRPRSVRDALSTFLCASTLIFAACGKDSAGDVAARDRDREREKAESLFDEDRLVEGFYQGQIDQGDVVLNIKASWGKADGGGSPAAVLVGALNFYPSMRVAGSDAPEISYPVDDGNYFKVSRSLTLNVSSGDRPTKFVCQAGDDVLDCRWYTPRGELPLRLKKTAAAPQVVRPRSTYVGSVEAFDVQASFDTLYSRGSSGRIVQSTLAGRFDFSLKNPHGPPNPPVTFRSVDGSYDFFKKTVNFVMEGDSPILVACRIVDERSLHCSWSASHSYEFDLELKDASGEKK